MKQTEFINLVIPFKDKLFRLAKRLLVSTEEAEDATQEVFIKLWNQQHKFKGIKSLEAFSVTITKNICLDRLKSKQAQQLKIAHSNYEDYNTSLQKAVETNDSLVWVEKFINELPDQQRIIIQLRDIEAYELKEIEDVMNMKPSAVRANLSRARKTIREKLIKAHQYGLKIH